MVGRVEFQGVISLLYQLFFVLMGFSIDQCLNSVREGSHLLRHVSGHMPSSVFELSSGQEEYRPLNVSGSMGLGSVLDDGDKS